MNPLFNLLGGGTNPMMAQIRNAGQMMRAMQNPQAYVMQQAQNNPQLQQVLTQYGGDPKAAFNALAKQMGVDPSEVMRNLGM